MISFCYFTAFSGYLFVKIAHSYLVTEFQAANFLAGLKTQGENLPGDPYKIG